MREKRVMMPSQRPGNDLAEGEPYFTGVYRWEWIQDAYKSGGGLVGMYMLRLAYIWQTDRPQVSAGQSAKVLGVDRSTFYRQLKALEKASLVAVDRCRRRWPIVRLLGNPIVKTRGAVSGEP